MGFIHTQPLFLLLFSLQPFRPTRHVCASFGIVTSRKKGNSHIWRDAGNLLAVWEGYLGIMRTYVLVPAGYVKDSEGVAQTWRGWPPPGCLCAAHPVCTPLHKTLFTCCSYSEGFLHARTKSAVISTHTYACTVVSSQANILRLVDKSPHGGKVDVNPRWAIAKTLNAAQASSTSILDIIWGNFALTAAFNWKS